MRCYLTLTRRELASFFLSLSGYVMLAGTTFAIGFSFWSMAESLMNEPTTMPVTEAFCYSWLFWMIMLLTTVVITMRLFALEKFSGTYETLMTTPVTDFQVVAAKFTAAFVFYVVMWLPLLGCILVLRHYASDRTALDLGLVGSTLLGIFLIGSVLISFGCLSSSLTRSQVIAATIAFIFGFSLMALYFVHAQVGSWQARVLARINLPDQMHDFSRGVVDTRPVVFCLALTFLFLFLTLRVVESRRWK